MSHLRRAIAESFDCAGVLPVSNHARVVALVGIVALSAAECSVGAATQNSRSCFGGSSI
jgi:hypothetical protein